MQFAAAGEEEEDSYSDVVVNRGDAIPVIRFSPRGDDLSELSSEDHEERPRTRDVAADKAHRFKGMVDGLSAGGAPRQAVYDRVFASIMSQIIPTEELSDGDVNGEKKKDRRSRTYVDRPNFSLPQMSNNFRRFNARIGVVFAFQNRLIHLFSWQSPPATLSFLAVYTLLSLNPHLLPLVPLVGILFFAMVPAFLARHPTPKNDPRIEPSLHGPPVAPARRVKPAPEMSRDFFRNMRDLQNCMEDFSVAHDAINDSFTAYINFSDEKVSSAIFGTLFVVSCLMFLASRFIPWKVVLLFGGWAAVAGGHPRVQELLLTSRNIKKMRRRISHLQTHVRNWVEMEVMLDGPPEARQVEMFELQKHHAESDTWEPWLFSPSPFDPLSPARIAGARAEGTQFFEEVEPPTGWVWKDKKWTLDLFSREWVEQRMITGVEVEIQGERWVYDIPTDEIDLLEQTSKGKASKKRNKSNTKPIPKSGWEEATGLEKRGEWRRRRWIRVVQRKVALPKPTTKPTTA